MQGETTAAIHRDYLLTERVLLAWPDYLNHRNHCLPMQMHDVLHIAPKNATIPIAMEKFFQIISESLAKA